MVQLEASWLAKLAPEFEQAYMQSLSAFLRAERAAGKRIYPKGADMFAAFEHTPLPKVRVVILGQDPYHGPEQAHGLSFSVPRGVAVPPSLRNIYKELSTDVGFVAPAHGNLQPWAAQGVLLLNSVLSVQAGMAASHQGQGWERFTDTVITTIDQHCEHVVFMLWGAYAQRKGAAINTDKHCVLKAPHPSPLSAHRGFFGCGHFSAANAYLAQHAIPPINWQLPQ